MIIEMIVAMFVAALFTTAICQMYVQAFSISNFSQNQIMAASIAQECIDTLRSMPYTSVASQIGVHYAIVSGTEDLCTDSVFTRPLLQDLTAFQYTGVSATVTGNNNRFNAVNNQAVVTISVQANSMLLVKVQLSYKDGTGTHTYTGNTIIVPNGLNS